MEADGYSHHVRKGRRPRAKTGCYKGNKITIRPHHMVRTFMEDGIVVTVRYRFERGGYLFAADSSNPSLSGIFKSIGCGEMPVAPLALL